MTSENSMLSRETLELVFNAGTIFSNLLEKKFIQFNDFNEEWDARKEIREWLYEEAIPGKWINNNIWAYGNLIAMMNFRLLTKYGTPDLGKMLLEDKMNDREKENLREDEWSPEKDQILDNETIAYFITHPDKMEPPNYEELMQELEALDGLNLDDIEDIPF